MALFLMTISQRMMTDGYLQNGYGYSLSLPMIILGLFQKGKNGAENYQARKTSTLKQCAKECYSL